MKSLVKLSLSFVAVLVSGCSTINYNVEAKTTFFSQPPLKEVVEVYVGDFMINQGQATTREYLVLQAPVDGFSYDIPAGAYARIGEYKGNPYFSSISSDGLTIGFAAGLIDPPKALHTKKPGEICVTSVSYQSAACYDAPVTVEERTLTGQQSFQQTLIYNGSVGKKINISYREFNDGMARNAFTNNVEYDMNKSNFINYKGARIEVLEFDNTSIKFRVLKHFRNDITVEI
ncbi:hypothetical protein RN22_12370 [Grimontia sp. AD028]|uniref:hypothetical protein n=1 Tax=Grimontia sp. AD028 TaxID=1581149 RepID=UPI00061B2862|nr:hypothetical protein [Grimontia sp. AD028]KKD60112.1 hypothetical protein RN22_12370 [Grimontia sp. AD028]